MHTAKCSTTYPSPFPSSLRTSPMPSLTHVSRRFCAAAQLILYRTFEHTTTAPAKADACVASLAATLHLAEMHTIFMYPFGLGLALRLVHFPHSALTFSQWHRFLRASRLLRMHPSLHILTSSSRRACKSLALPNFVGVPPGPGEVCR